MNNHYIVSMMSLLLFSNVMIFGMEIFPGPSPLVHQEIRNLKKIYKNPNSTYVKKMLNKHHVPIVIIDLSLCNTGECIAADIINPYDASFYSNHQNHLLSKKLKVIEKQRFDEAYLDCLNIRTQQIRALNFPVPNYFTLTVIKKNNPLILAAILGNRNDISNVLEENVNDSHITPMDLSSRVLHAIIVSACYPSIKKNNLQLLLLEQKKIQKYSNYAFPDREINAYNLLSYSAKNKAAFAVIAQEDPYAMNNILWKHNYEINYLTHIDRMFEDPNFDEDHIAIMMENGGTTSQDLLEKDTENNSGEW